MDLDLYFSSNRWDVLKILATSPSSPSEISEKLNTSVAYISQQLKLLEAAGLITKTKTGSVDKGKPRSLYSITNEVLYFASLARYNPSKKLIHLQGYQKVILRIWSLEDQDLHYYLEKFYWEIESYLEEIDSIHYLDSKVIIVSNSKKIQTITNSFFKKINKKINFSIISQLEFTKLSKDSAHTIYDSHNSESQGGTKN
jgi:predicted transcriptional regulator